MRAEDQLSLQALPFRRIRAKHWLLLVSVTVCSFIVASVFSNNGEFWQWRLPDNAQWQLRSPVLSRPLPLVLPWL
ncbi:hypothetical protein [Aliamphritea spongicola]|nr:hypothetical protein [Aliamphritea spongicola]